MAQAKDFWLEGLAKAGMGLSNEDAQPERRRYRQDTFFYLLTKRAMDFVLSGAAILALFPFLLIVALMIYMDDPHASPIFVQKRAGKNGKVFRLYKFRSMYSNAEQIKSQLMEKNEMSGPVFKMKDDPRVTRIGRFLRKTSIDELPQFFNVLFGDMSLVGPRPLPVAEASAVSGIGKIRELVKPGITCIWQVSGRNNIDFEEWMKLDALYVEKRGLRMDLKLLIQTVPAVFFSRGAS